MINIFVDSKNVDFENVAYHSQSIPKPGGHKYNIDISLDETELLNIFEKMLQTKFKSELFISRGIESGLDSSFNLVRYVLEWKAKQCENKIIEYKLTWVFNNITNFKINDEKIVIEGIASEVVRPF
jgi:hypothetical protein